MKKDRVKEVPSKVLHHLLFNYGRWSTTELLVPFIECAPLCIKTQVKESVAVYNNLSVRSLLLSGSLCEFIRNKEGIKRERERHWHTSPNNTNTRINYDNEQLLWRTFSHWMKLRWWIIAKNINRDLYTLLDTLFLQHKELRISFILWLSCLFVERFKFYNLLNYDDNDP